VERRSGHYQRLEEKRKKEKEEETSLSHQTCDFFLLTKVSALSEYMFREEYTLNLHRSNADLAVKKVTRSMAQRFSNETSN